MKDITGLRDALLHMADEAARQKKDVEIAEKFYELHKGKELDQKKAELEDRYGELFKVIDIMVQEEVSASNKHIGKILACAKNLPESVRDYIFEACRTMTLIFIDSIDEMTKQEEKQKKEKENADTVPTGE